ncbi:hypothetical protein H5410_024785 [Solanum commersonii]|uniref:Uncharacterized protein n=1 Tax=Solanum commersonii TaxID=4109 RepID=A0A9J5ZMY6_SOLCO|nr:hypothetical protein H5410_024785 [Solanum commersonii]
MESGRLKFVVYYSAFLVFGWERDLHARQVAGRALLGVPTQLRGYCQKISPTKTSRRVGHDVRAFIGGGLVSACFYLYRQSSNPVQAECLDYKGAEKENKGLRGKSVRREHE